MGKQLLSIDESIARTGLSRTTIFERLASGELRSIKVGRRRLIPESAVDEFVERLEQGVSSGSDVA